MIFFLFHTEIEGNVGGLLGGGGPKGMLAPPPLSNYWGGTWPPWPPQSPTPMLKEYQLTLGVNAEKLTHVRSVECSSLVKWISPFFN